MKRKMVLRRRDRRTRLTQVWMDGPSPIAAGQGHRHHRHFCCRHQHFYLVYNHRHHQRVSLGLLTRNYTSELQLSGPGPVTPEKQQVMVIVLMVLMMVMMMVMMMLPQRQGLDHDDGEVMKVFTRMMLITNNKNEQQFVAIV